MEFNITFKGDPSKLKATEQALKGTKIAIDMVSEASKNGSSSVKELWDILSRSFDFGITVTEITGNPLIGLAAGLGKANIELKKSVESFDQRKIAEETQKLTDQNQAIREHTGAIQEWLSEHKGGDIKAIAKWQIDELEARIAAINRIMEIQKGDKNNIIVYDNPKFSKQQQEIYRSEIQKAEKRKLAENYALAQDFMKQRNVISNATFETFAQVSLPKQKSTSSPSKPTDPRSLPTAEVNPLALKNAGDVVGLLNTQMKDAKLATVELGKSFQQTGQQASKALGGMAQDAKKTGISLSTISDTGAMIGKTIAQSIESGTGALKAVLKKILTMLLDFLEKELLAAEAAATLRTLFGDFSAVAQIAAGVAAIELAKVAINSFAQGGWINEPVVGRGLRSGQIYTLGERGPEYVTPRCKVIPFPTRARFTKPAMAA